MYRPYLRALTFPFALAGVAVFLCLIGLALVTVIPLILPYTACKEKPTPEPMRGADVLSTPHLVRN
jgi:hypothetical protein